MGVEKTTQRGALCCVLTPNTIRLVISRKMRWEGHVAGMEYNVMMGRLKGRRTLGRPRRRWENSIKMDA
jgi:hypothetical protein